MAEEFLHIISFDVPYPPDYGGVIDVFYKIKALSEAGVKIILHCFDYGRNPQAELDKYCEKVYYYKRKNNFTNLLDKLPYIVKSRANKTLLSNLLQDNYPILFEGLHTCYFINHKALKNRKKAVRTHNIEHLYYEGLAKAEKSKLKKQYLKTESKKLKDFESALCGSDAIFAISEGDTNYFQSNFKNVFYLPVFHGFHIRQKIAPSSDFALYHGNLSVAENAQAAAFLTNEVFSNLDIKLVIAGNNPPEYLVKLISKHKNISLIQNTTTSNILDLVSSAQINILPTFQATGIKLKLLAALFLGNHCIVNDAMVANTGLSSCCKVANSPTEMKIAVNSLIKQKFTVTELSERNTYLADFTPQKGISVILKWMNE